MATPSSYKKKSNLPENIHQPLSLSLSLSLFVSEASYNQLEQISNQKVKIFKTKQPRETRSESNLYLSPRLAETRRACSLKSCELSFLDVVDCKGDVVSSVKRWLIKEKKINYGK
jgi:hypothetical protein